jgi:protein-L-isoaspartate(D-aspartate) O-methyltransferase
MTDFEHARRAMVDNQLRTSGITDRRILAAMGEVRRELFVPEPRRSLAYIDEAHVLPGPSGRAIPAPAPFARLLQLAEVEQSDAVLDVGAGTGYSAAVLHRLCSDVTALESDAALVAAARERLAEAGAAGVRLVQGSLFDGAPNHGPFDVILLEGAVAEVPDSLLAQLKEGGRLVALVRKGVSSAANVFVRNGDEFAPRIEFNATMPALAREQPADDFVF